MPKGFTATTLAIIVTVVLTSSLVGWVVYSNSNTPKVKGVSSSGDVIKPGFSVDVASNRGTWDLYVFLCEKKETCLEGLETGVRWITRGGGKTVDSEVFVEARNSWDKYDYIKVFVKPGWGSEERKFTPVKENVPLEVQTQTINDVETILLPTEVFAADFYKVAKFSD
ncbi:MAG: hypothetical protein WC243_02510, partial [Patescibacteria group bacterium]|jgi:hypothetical protein